MNNVYLIDVLWPNSKVNQLARNFFIVAIGVILLIASAKINIPIPPVPVTLQTLVVLVFAAAVGWRYATSSFIAYMFLGFIGIPVFATWPYAGPAFFYGPAIGYVLGMLIASFFVGYLAEKNYDRNYFKSLIIGLAMVLNLIVAGFAGTIIPLTLDRLNIDPALASGVILTTITDVFGFLSFLGLATIFLL